MTRKAAMTSLAVLVTALAWAGKPLKTAPKSAPAGAAAFRSEKDLISLHYDHAPDRDDGHSAAADRTILETHFGRAWLKAQVIAVSGAYGKNAKRFVPASDKVMDAVWADCGGWQDAHRRRDAVLVVLVERWGQTLDAGGDVWVKEGGQSDITADVIRRLKKAHPKIDLKQRVHVVQHSDWNERMTTDADLAYTKAETDYIRIRDANRYLNIRKGDASFVAAALAHPTFGPCWKAAFTYYDPKRRLDFSDTGELMRILGLGKMNIRAFQQRYLRPVGSQSRVPTENLVRTGLGCMRWDNYAARRTALIAAMLQRLSRHSKATNRPGIFCYEATPQGKNIAVPRLSDSFCYSCSRAQGMSFDPACAGRHKLFSCLRPQKIHVVIPSASNPLYCLPLLCLA